MDLNNSTGRDLKMKKRGTQTILEVTYPFIAPGIEKMNSGYWVEFQLYNGQRKTKFPFTIQVFYNGQPMSPFPEMTLSDAFKRQEKCVASMTFFMSKEGIQEKH